MSNKLSEVFDVNPIKIFSPIVDHNVDPRTEIKDDATKVRENMRGLIDTGTKALEEALEVALMSESPRAYEVVTGLISAMSDLNSKLLATHKMEQEISKSSGTPVIEATQNNVTNNILFNGTPSELSKLISQHKVS